jgi:hypothetical protein
MLNATHHLLNLMKLPSASDYWLCLTSGPLHFVATPLSLLNQSVHDTISNCTSTKPKVKNIQLSQRAPSCIYNSRGYYPVGELTASQCAQIQNCTANAIWYTVDRPWCSSPGTFFVCCTLPYQCLPGNWKGICMLAFLNPHSDLPYTFNGPHMVKESYPTQAFINQIRDNIWDRNRHRSNFLIILLL